MNKTLFNSKQTNIMKHQAGKETMLPKHNKSFQLIPYSEEELKLKLFKLNLGCLLELK